MSLPLPSPPDYTDRDFTSIRARIQTLITGAFPSWVSFVKSRFENVLLDAFAYMMDVLNFYLDQQARETRWGTARLRKNMIELAKLIDYALDTRIAAQTDEVFSIPSAVAGNVVIPSGSIIKTPGYTNVVKFQSISSATIVAGNTSSAAVIAEHSQAAQQVFTATGEPDEEFVLTSTPFIDLSDVLEIAAVTWTRQIDLLDSGAADTHYTIKVDENDKAVIKLGDGTYGVQAAAGAAVTVTHKVGGGEDGNVDASTLTKLEGGPFYDSFGTRVNVTCDNALAAVGGIDRESVAQARLRAPRSLRVLNRTVARTDYEDRAIQVSGVARTLALSVNQLAGIPEGWVWLWLVPDSLGQPSGALITAVETAIETDYPIPVTTNLEVRTVTNYKTVNVAATVYLDENATHASVETSVRAALTEFFAPTDADGDPNPLIKFGYYYKAADGTADPKVALSDVANVINDADGIHNLGTPDDGEGTTLDTAEDDVVLLAYQFPLAGTLVLTDGADSSTIYSGAI